MKCLTLLKGSQLPYELLAEYYKDLGFSETELKKALEQLMSENAIRVDP
jgi:hypothetical protein